MTYQDIQARILQDGYISANEVLEIQKLINDDEGMTLDKGNLLFSLKDHAVKGKIDPSFKKVFVDAITAFLLEDSVTTGEIDENEARWLRAKIQYNGHFDSFDHALIENLKKKSMNFPKILQYKSRRARMFENALYSSRYLSLLAVIGALLSSIALFLRGAMIVYHSIYTFIYNLQNHIDESYEVLFEELVSSVDVFLFALVLIIFGVGVYELFINKIDPVERQNDTRPSWLRISSVDDLKSSLGKVILMVLIVSFFKHTLEIAKSAWTPTALLYLSIGILLISAALYLTHKSHGGSEEEEH